ncbi:hypothetical protein [Psychroflexus sp. MES1-P1E]|uniref:hypothetical protein n=1 Tax=Psychroflexus sp. MES1-P1E TaxID=2058320 RepID=UPI000C7D29C5|nr:hypothetical protein [Psychroflexus sp. MES1-P1E]PKG42336.1 hypothetical protein CXF67_10840 [Psychroflexus sp. MES1-P1E]
MKHKSHINSSKSGFEVPEGYFDSIDQTMACKVKSKSENSNFGYKVPESYFKDFSLAVPLKESSSKVIKLKELSKWVAAASILAFAVLGALYINDISPDENLQFSDLDRDMIEDYLDYNMENPEEFIDYENTSSINSIVNDNIVNLKDNDILEYLNDEIEDQDYGNE